MDRWEFRFRNKSLIERYRGWYIFNKYGNSRDKCVRILVFPIATNIIYIYIKKNLKKNGGYRKKR